MIHSSDSSDTVTLMVQPDQLRNDQRATILLYQLNRAVFIATLIGLVLTLIPPLPPPIFLFIIGLSLIINGLIYWTLRTGYAQLGAHLFAHWINLGIALLFLSNLWASEPNLSSATLYSAILAMAVMLAGLLLQPSSVFFFAAFDSLLVVIGYLFFQGIPQLPGDSLIGRVSQVSFPVIVLLFMCALIIYLSRWALTQSERRLSLAREQIMRDELLRRDMAVARQMQQQLYPPPPLTSAQITIAALSEPARETSGDFYDYIELGAGLLGIVVADVTGKSLAAAMVMAMARSAIRSEARRYSSPTEVLHHANQTLCADRWVHQFLTCFYGVLDTDRMELRFANAGHPYPILRRDGVLSELINNGLPLGARSDAQYEDQVIQLRPGDQLILLSDGTFEERNEQRELFGFDRLHATINAVKGDDPHRMVNAIKAAVDQFRGSREQSDDLTMVAIQFQSQVAAVGEPLFIASPASAIGNPV